MGILTRAIRCFTSSMYAIVIEYRSVSLYQQKWIVSSGLTYIVEDPKPCFAFGTLSLAFYTHLKTILSVEYVSGFQYSLISKPSEFNDLKLGHSVIFLITNPCYIVAKRCKYIIEFHDTIYEIQNIKFFLLYL